MPIIGVIVWVIMICWITYQGLIFFIYNVRPNYWQVFKEFRQKMWMTIGLGLIFFGLYAGLVWLSSYLMDATTKQQLFALMYAHPKECIYVGLCVFVFLSVSIYFVRLFIKYLYKKFHTIRE